MVDEKCPDCGLLVETVFKEGNKRYCEICGSRLPDGETYQSTSFNPDNRTMIKNT